MENHCAQGGTDYGATEKESETLVFLPGASGDWEFSLWEVGDGLLTRKRPPPGPDCWTRQQPWRMSGWPAKCWTDQGENRKRIDAARSMGHGKRNKRSRRGVKKKMELPSPRVSLTHNQRLNHGKGDVAMMKVPVSYRNQSYPTPATPSKVRSGSRVTEEEEAGRQRGREGE